MAMIKCGCGQPTRDDGYVCDTCLDAYRSDLADIPMLADELLTALSRQARVTVRVGSRSTETPLPFSWPASVMLDTVYATLQPWVTITGSATRAPATRAPATRAPATRAPATRAPATGSPATTAALTGLLASRLDWARINPDGPQLVDEIRYLAREMRRTIDQPPVRLYAGPCLTRLLIYNVSHADGLVILDAVGETHCTEPLHAAPGAAVITCRVCGARHAAHARREWLLAEAQSALLPLDVIWESLPTLGAPQPPWDAFRRLPGRVGNRRLEQRGVNAHGEPLYRCGDALHLAAIDTTRLRRRQRLHVTG